MLLRSVAIANNRFKSTAIARRDHDDNSCSHIESSNCFGLFGNLTIALLYIGCRCKIYDRNKICYDRQIQWFYSKSGPVTAFRNLRPSSFNSRVVT